MKRTSRISPTSRPALLGAVALLALTSVSVATADEGRRPHGATAGTSGRAGTADAAGTRVVVGAPPGDRVGALFAADGAGGASGGHFCTASVVHSPRGDLIVTAAHCVDADNGDVVFAPGYRGGRAPYGMWEVTRRFLSDGWAEDQDEDSDLAFAVVAERDGRRLEDVVGANRFATGTVTGAAAVTVTGYPDSRETPVACTNRPALESSTQQRIACPGFTSGTSGSPWVNGDHQVVGVLGGHEKGGATADVSYSVVLGEAAADLYREATGAS
ncbi:trypsin-like peptidase domain-containing protein [Streptomyces sp. Caat 7-52]|uniref:trypsin-like serine peptidase n=1 Tax=Streptomyces sp. Caat 7-52 TaxID=2949637 RepID=UPI0020362FB5|nr:trypsin-like peptidase domain-containing protein [Streptomyces sp. Caat 7-52]